MSRRNSLRLVVLLALVGGIMFFNSIHLKTKQYTPIALRPLTEIEKIKFYVLQKCDYKMKCFRRADFIINHESGYQPSAIGDDGKSLGLWQIYLRAHPEITKKVAFNPYEATNWAIPQLLKNPNQWSVYRNCWEYYRKCPK